MISLAKRGSRASIAIALLAFVPAESRSQTPAPPGRLTPPTSISAADYAARRAFIASKVDSGVILAFGESEPLVYYPTFFQMPNFEYLTGFDESDAVMLVLKRHGTTSATMFVPTQSPMAARFVGDRTAIADMQRTIGMQGQRLGQLRSTVDSLVAAGLPVYFIPAVHTGDWFDDDTLTFGARFISNLRTAHPSAKIATLDSAITELREK